MSKFTEYLEMVEKLKQPSIKSLQKKLEKMFFRLLENGSFHDEVIDILKDIIIKDHRYDSDKYSIDNMEEDDKVIQAIEYIGTDKERIEGLIEELNNL
jgi:hypothetical protein